MKIFQSPLLVSTLAALFIAGCETLPEAQTSQSAQIESPQLSATSSELVNRSQVVATVKSKAVAVDLERQALEWGYTLNKQEKLAGLNLYLLTFDCPPGVSPKEASLELERLQPKSSVGELNKYSLNSSQVSFAPSQAPKTFAPKTFANEMLGWPESGCDVPVKIGIIDGGLSEKFRQQTSAKVYTQSFIETAPSQTAMRHGTSIAAILTDPARLKDVRLYSAAVVEQDDNGNDYSSPAAILKALNWMVLNDVKVVNISLSGPPNKVLETALDAASDKGLLIVAAVGNQGQSSPPQFPAAYNTVLAATAVDVEGDIYEKAVRGHHVDFSAPGVDIYINIDGQNRYISGTSIAAPFITAAIASSLGMEAYENRDDIIQYFSGSATDLGPKGKDTIFGRGLINAKYICNIEQTNI